MSTADQIIALRQSRPDMNTAGIAAELGVTRQRVSNVLRKAGLPSDFRGIIPARGKGPAVTPFLELNPFGQALNLLGLDNEEAAKIIGAHSVTVSKYAHGTRTPPVGTGLLVLAALGIGLEGVRAAVREGQRKLTEAVDAEKAAAKI